MVMQLAGELKDLKKRLYSQLVILIIMLLEEISQNKTNAVGKVIALNKEGTFEVLSSG